MATQGPLTFFDWALKKTWDGTIQLSAHSFRALLCSSGQVINRSFVGSSTDARYSDLTAELASGSGYTSGGQTLASVTLTRATASKVAWSCTPPAWMVVGGTPLTMKYLLIVDWSAPNKDLLAFCDFDTGGGSVAVAAGPFAVTPDAVNGFLYNQQL